VPKDPNQKVDKEQEKLAKPIDMEELNANAEQGAHLIGGENQGDDLEKLYPEVVLSKRIGQKDHIIWTKKSKFQGVTEKSAST
jgi:hypothetical protein